MDGVVLRYVTEYNRSPLAVECTSCLLYSFPPVTGVMSNSDRREVLSNACGRGIFTLPE